VFAGGGFNLLGVQALAAVVAVGFCFGMTWLLAKGVDLVLGLRVTPEHRVHRGWT